MLFGFCFKWKTLQSFHHTCIVVFRTLFHLPSHISPSWQTFNFPHKFLVSYNPNPLIILLFISLERSHLMSFANKNIYTVLHLAHFEVSSFSVCLIKPKTLFVPLIINSISIVEVSPNKNICSYLQYYVTLGYNVHIKLICAKSINFLPIELSELICSIQAAAQIYLLFFKSLVQLKQISY